MPSFEALLFAGTLILLALGGLGLFAVLRGSGASRATDALGRGHFSEVLQPAAIGARPSRDDLFAAAVAAKHLLDFPLAAGLLDRLLAADPEDGEAWLERGLVTAYAGLGGEPTADAANAADTALRRALAIRSDLAESITLHRAWLALGRGDRAAARRLFDEVEAPLETKLRSDLGTGEPLFAEWFLHAAVLWEALGEDEKARWARESARSAAPESRLPDLLGSTWG